MGKGFGTAALTLGIIGFILIIGWLFGPLAILIPLAILRIGWIFGALAIIFGIIGIAKDDSKGSGMAGLILGIIALLLYIGAGLI